MFDVSWTEVLVVGGIGLAVIGPRDLPKAAHTLGASVGRIVGLLQGARARADQFAAQSELQQLQNELRSGLRDLDAVKAEMAVSMSPGRMIGRDLGRMTGNAVASRMAPHQLAAPSPHGSTGSIMNTSSTATLSRLPPSSSANDPLHNTSAPEAFDSRPLPMSTSTLFQTQAAAAEAEWAQKGIAFQSTAEKRHNDDAGSVQLAHMLQQSLLFDRYDQAVAEQDASLQSKVEQIREKVESERKTGEKKMT